MAAEYILKEGNETVMLCERGIRTFETAYRFTLDLHGRAGAQGDDAPAGRSSTRATPRAGATGRAAVAGGRGGRRRRHHRRGAPEPEEAICDGPQALRADGVRRVRREGRAGRRRSPASCSVPELQASAA